ncbi:hypothetical protein IAT38_004571 [Cryptococcus sp. DSM 104549]
MRQQQSLYEHDYQNNSNQQQQQQQRMNSQQLHPQQQQQQPQQQYQQQQSQQQQQGGPQSVNGTADGGSGSQGPGPEMNLAGVLHYLQSEWRRWERDRNEWEIERAEMRARIALLEGQRRSAENLKVDLLRRVKMLEYALRQERTKTVSSGKANSIHPARLATLQDEERLSRDEKEGSGSEGSQEDSPDKLPKMNGVHPAAIGKASTVASRSQPAESQQWKSIGSAPRDPKSRARSREYLKQCLQEISYLTSPGALNPLPPHAPVDPPTFPQPENGHDLNQPPVGFLERPHKVLQEQSIPSNFPHPREESHAPKDGSGPELLNGVRSEPTESSAPVPAPLPTSAPMEKQISPPQIPQVAALQEGLASTSGEPPSSPAPNTVRLPEEPTQEGKLEDQGKQLLTAVYRPDSKTAWREELRAANEKAGKAREDRSRVASEVGDDDQLASLSLMADDEEVKPEDGADKVWTSRKNLKSHLDIVRTIAFAHGPGLLLATGSDDCTVKVWSVETGSVMSHRPTAVEVEPIVTYRGHTAAVTAVTISSALATIFSASLDSTIRLWRLPPHNHDPYSQYDPSSSLQTLVGHTEAVWDICLLPSHEVVHPGKKAVEGRLVSASSDGSVKLWERTSASPEWKLERSYSDFGGKGVVPTCLSVFNLDFTKVLVGTSDGKARLWDVEEGREVQVFGDDSEGPGSQVNAILSHPTLPAIVTAHEDGNIRFYDAKSGSSTPTHTILAHPAPVTSLALSPSSPTCILTSSTDCSVRLWDLGKKTSIQDLSGHRSRAEEGVCAVSSHPELPVIGTAGADGAVRLWGAG